MKKADLKPGMIVAVTRGASRYDRSYDGIENARKAKVIVAGVPAKDNDPRIYKAMNDHTEVEVLGPKPVAGWGLVKRVPAGSVMRVPTRSIWMPWAEFEQGVAEYAEAEAERKAEREVWATAAARRKKRVVALVGKVDEADLTHSQRGYREIGITEELFDKLLDRAEGKS